MNFRRTIGATLTLATALSPAAPGFAQKGPAAPTDPFAEAYDFCMETISATLDNAVAALQGAGWTTEILAPIGGWTNLISAERSTGTIEAYFFAEVTDYPATFHSYCAYDLYGVTGPLDLEGVAERFQLDGRAEAGPDGTYGAWEMPLDEGMLVISAYQEEDYFRFQFNWFEWGGPRG